jgi:hypothetical protein
MKRLARDTIVGVIAGLIAVGVNSFNRGRPSIPGGVYQASINLSRYREMEQMVRSPGDSAGTLAKLRTRIDAPDVRGAAFDKVLAYLEDVSGVEFDVEWAVLADAQTQRNAPVNVRLRGVTVAEALREALDSAPSGQQPLAWQVEAGRVRISTEGTLFAETVVRVYDVADIVSDLYAHDRALYVRRVPRAATGPVRSERPGDWIRRFPAHGSGWTLEFADFATTPEEIIESLATFLASRADSSDYNRRGPGTIFVWGSRLIVKHPRPNQDQIAMWLAWIRDDLRRSGGPQ